MALPTLRPSWVKTFKNPAELSARKIEREETSRAQWANNYGYFRTAEVTASKNKSWTSERSFKQSMNAVDRIFSKAVKEEKHCELAKRREKLREMLSNENKLFQKELKEIKLSYGSLKFLEMQKRIDALNAEKENQRKEVADKKLHEHWRNNDPRIREMVGDRNRKKVVVSWKDQLEEKESARNNMRAEEQRLDEMARLQHQQAEAEEKEKAIELSRRNERIATELREQMAALHRKENEAKMLKAEETKLRLHNQALNEAEEKRRAYENQRKKYEQGRVLIRQYKQQLQRKSQQVQEALKMDLQILQEIAEKEKEEEEIKSSRREKAKADAAYMQQVVSEQLRLEKMREAELDMMFQEEAMRQWRKRESEWEREKIARERLMKAVLEERQQQIAEKMEVLYEKQKETVEERERLLQNIEEHQLLTHREQNEKITKKKQREEEIMEQITARETERERLKRLEEEDLIQKRAEGARYEAMLGQEEQRLQTENYSPPQSFRRKRVAFT